MKTIRAGIIGTGFIGKLHIEAIMRIPGSTITAVCHHSGERLNAVKEQFNITRGYEDWRDLIDDPNVDVVHNCTPNHLHDEINRAAIMAGKHVYSEKPLSLNASNAFELYRLACEKGVAHGVNHQYRLNAAVQEMRERINGGECGRILFVRGHYLQESHAQKTDYSKRLIPETSPARALADIGTHWVDTVYCVTGKRIASVYVDMHTHHPVRIDPATGKEIPIHSDDTSVVLLRFEDGTPGTMLVSKVACGHKNDLSVTVQGEKSEYTWNQELPDRLFIGSREQPNGVLFMNPKYASAAAAPYITTPAGHVMGWTDALRNSVNAFYTSIRNRTYANHNQPYCAFEDGWHTIAFIEACLKSVQENRWVNIEKDVIK